MGAPSKAPGGGAHRRACGEADQTAERTHGRQEVWKAGGCVWRTVKPPPTDASTGTLRPVRALLKKNCGTAGADGRAVKGTGTSTRARGGESNGRGHTRQAGSVKSRGSASVGSRRVGVAHLDASSDGREHGDAQAGKGGVQRSLREPARMGAPSKAPGGGAHRRACGEADQTAERTHGRQEVWKAGGCVWRTVKPPPTDASTGKLRLVRAPFSEICGTAGADGRAVKGTGGRGT
eukprot:scaffold4774_cov78-Isochrysis_galbana.AAC.4